MPERLERSQLGGEGEEERQTKWSEGEAVAFVLQGYSLGLGGDSHARVQSSCSLTGQV